MGARGGCACCAGEGLILLSWFLPFAQDAREADRPALASHLTPLISITRSYLDGASAYAHEIGMSLFEAFLNVEERFQRGSEATEQEIIDELRQVCLASAYVCHAIAPQKYSSVSHQECWHKAAQSSVAIDSFA